MRLSLTFITGRAGVWISSQTTHHHCVHVPHTRLIATLVTIALLTPQFLHSEREKREREERERESLKNLFSDKQASDVWFT